MPNFYASLESNFFWGKVCEPKAENIYLYERHLHALWLEQKYFTALFTHNNQRITILSPGIWNAGAGPDFLHAHFIIENEEIKGDVEIHLSDESWFRHGHHEDERYKNVVLHISFWKPNKKQALCTNQGRELFCTYLESALTIPMQRIVKLIDLELYPYKEFVGAGRCARELFSHLSEKTIADFFYSAALYRLQKKAHYLLERFAENAIFGGISMALGYKQNAENFALLFKALLPLLPAKEEELLSYALGLCGFFSPTYREKWSQNKKYKEPTLFGNKISKKSSKSNLTYIKSVP